MSKIKQVILQYEDKVEVYNRNEFHSFLKNNVLNIFEDEEEKGAKKTKKPKNPKKIPEKTEEAKL